MQNKYGYDIKNEPFPTSNEPLCYDLDAHLQVTQQGLESTCVLDATGPRAQLHWLGEIQNQLKGSVADQIVLHFQQES